MNLIDVFSTNSFFRQSSEKGSLTLADDWETSSEYPLAIAELSILDAVLHARQESVTRGSRSTTESRKEKGGLFSTRSLLETSNPVTMEFTSLHSSSRSNTNNTTRLHDFEGSAAVTNDDLHMNNAPTPPQPPMVTLRKLSSSSTSSPSPVLFPEGGDAMLSALSLAMRFDPSLREEVLKLVNRVSLPEIPSEKPHSTVLVSRIESLLRASIKTSSEIPFNDDNTSPLSLNVADSPSSPSFSFTQSSSTSSLSPPPTLPCDLSTQQINRILNTIYTSTSSTEMNDGVKDKLTKRALLLHSAICSEVARRRACALIVELSSRGFSQLAVCISRWVPPCQAVFESTTSDNEQINTSVDAVIQQLKEVEEGEGEWWLNREQGQAWLQLPIWPLPFKVIDSSLHHISEIEKTILPCPRFKLVLESRINRSDLVYALAALYIVQGFLDSPLLGTTLKHPSTIADLLVILF